MAVEEAVWSTWLTPQQVADLTGLGGDFAGDAVEVVDAWPPASLPVVSRHSR
jgi:hypothetical protein